MLQLVEIDRHGICAKVEKIEYFGDVPVCGKAIRWYVLPRSYREDTSTEIWLGSKLDRGNAPSIEQG
jgi:hypothetical protein